MAMNNLDGATKKASQSGMKKECKEPLIILFNTDAFHNLQMTKFTCFNILKYV